ncbi:MAG: M67 family metallopeptidase [Thermoproteota archaeon]|nr:M67 family metallopeptidase [Thermoproteota archaeon]MDQ3883250.1 M67 family metallopeptidase [Thermoproteota archaeon]
MRTISLTADQIRKLVGIARDALPNESCALLLGNDDNIKKILKARNSDESPVRFSIEPKELIHAYSFAESIGMQVIAIFHSHPANPWPSSTDVRFMEINPIIWVIYSTTCGELKAFLYDDDQLLKEVRVRIIDPRE